MKVLEERARQARTALAALHPELFDLKNPRPFKHGFRADFVARYPEMPKRLMGTLLHWLTGRRRYLAVCIEGAQRWGFDGPEGTVSAEEAAYAEKRYREREGAAPVEERRAA